MEKFNNIVKFYNRMPLPLQQETMRDLKELKVLVCDEVTIPELEGNFKVEIRQALQSLDDILRVELTDGCQQTREKLLALKERLIMLVTADYKEVCSYGAILTFSHYINYILFVIIKFEHYLQSQVDDIKYA